MSNIPTVQAMYEAFGRGDVPAILEQMSDDVVWEAWDGDNAAQDAGVPWVLARKGKDGVAGFFQDVAAGLEFHSFEPRNLMEGGSQVAATIAIDATAKATGEREIHLWTFDDAGKVTGMRHYMDTAKHIRAVKGTHAGVA